jgi:hypothetical protein
MQRDQNERLSRVRKTLAELAEEIDALLPVFTDRSRIVKGTVYEQRRKCGKPTCYCATGKLHASMMLSRSEEGRTKLTPIAPEQVEGFRVLTERYQNFRRARARLGQIYKKMIELIDQLEEARRKAP